MSIRNFIEREFRIVREGIEDIKINFEYIKTDTKSNDWVKLKLTNLARESLTLNSDWEFEEGFVDFEIIIEGKNEIGMLRDALGEMTTILNDFIEGE